MKILDWAKDIDLPSLTFERKKELKTIKKSTKATFEEAYNEAVETRRQHVWRLIDETSSKDFKYKEPKIRWDMSPLTCFNVKSMSDKEFALLRSIMDADYSLSWLEYFDAEEKRAVFEKLWRILKRDWLLHPESYMEYCTRKFSWPNQEWYNVSFFNDQ